MAYTISKTNGTTITVVADGTVDSSSTSLTLIGKNYAGYGIFLNENNISLLENFSSGTPPNVPLTGQLWFDSTSRILNVFDATQWKAISGGQSGPTAPINSVVGDLWWDSNNNQLSVYNGTTWVLIGPTYTTASGQNGAIVETVIDTISSSHVVIKFYINNVVMSIVSKDTAFTPQPVIPGYTQINPGINLISIAAIPGSAIWGDVSNALTVGGIQPTALLRKDQAGVLGGTLTINTDDGLIVGTTQSCVISVGSEKETNLTNKSDFNLWVTLAGGLTKAMSVSGKFSGGTGQVSLPIIIASTTPTTGALVVTGGVGISGALNIAGQANIIAVSASTNSTTGALVVAGGVGIGGAISIGGALTAASANIAGLSLMASATVSSSTITASTTTGALVVTGGTGISGNLNIGQTLGLSYNANKFAINMNLLGDLEFIAGKAAGLALTPADVTINGTTKTVTIGANLAVGPGSATTYSTVKIYHTTTSVSTTTGALQVAGGAGITGNVNIGGILSVVTPASTENSTVVPTTEWVRNNAGGFRAQIVYTSGSATVALPTGVTKCKVTVIGGGGGGGGVPAVVNSSGGGGGSGGVSIKYFTGVGGLSYTYTVGAGGPSALLAGSAGIAGSNSTFVLNTITVTANGGNGGAVGANSATAPAAGAAGAAAGTGGDINLPGSYGSNSIAGATYFISAGGDGAPGYLGTGAGRGGGYNIAAAAGSANTGAGGGGAITSGTAAYNSVGGSGIIIIEY